jgi:Fe-S cluster assembly iron-binding protein IscA
MLELKNEQQPIKLKITGYSWCGAELGIVSEKQSDEDKIFNVEGIDLIVSDELVGAIKGAEIDYTNGVFRKGFEVVAKFN